MFLLRPSNSDYFLSTYTCLIMSGCLFLFANDMMLLITNFVCSYLIKHTLVQIRAAEGLFILELCIAYIKMQMYLSIIQYVLGQTILASL